MKYDNIEGRPRGRFIADDLSTHRTGPGGRRGRRDPQRVDPRRSEFPGDAGDLHNGRRHHQRGPLRDERGEGRDRERGAGRGRERGDGRGRGRAQRGDVRAAILLLLGDQPMHGYQLMHAISQRTEGAWRPSPGAIYPTIAVLEDEQLVSVAPEGGRKLVSLTESGREYLRDNAGTIADPFSAITADRGGRNDLRSSVDQLYAAARAVADSGTREQIASAQGVLEQTKRSLYLILAGRSVTDGPVDPAQI